MTKWRGITDEMTTKEIVAQSRIPDTSYPHKAECARVLGDRVELMERVVEAAVAILGQEDTNISLVLEDALFDDLAALKEQT